MVPHIIDLTDSALCPPPPSPVFCHFQGPINYSESLGFPWDVCISLWETAKHLGKAVWAEMTAKLEGMLTKSNNHSTQIYWASIMFQEPCRVHTGRWALLRLSFLPVQHLRTWESSYQAAPQTSPKRRFYKILPILWARKGYPSVLHLCVELIKKRSCPAWPYLLRWGAELNKKWQWQCTRLLKISPLLNNSTPPCTHVFMLGCTHITHTCTCAQKRLTTPCCLL